MRTAAVVLLVALAGLMLLPALAGYRRYVITGGSMRGALPRGSIAYEREVPVGRLRVGDVITYVPPGRREPITHRIAVIGDAGVLRTKGDRNPVPDPWRVRLRAPSQPVVSFHVPLAGYAFSALALRPVRMLVIGLPALVVAAWSLRRIRRPA